MVELVDLVAASRAIARDTAEFLRAWRRSFPRTRLSCIGKFARCGARPAGALNLEDYHGFEHLR